MTGIVHVVPVELTLRISVKMRAGEYEDCRQRLAVLLMVRQDVIEQMFGPVLLAAKEHCGADWREPGVLHLTTLPATMVREDQAPVAMELEIDYEPRKKHH